MNTSLFQKMIRALQIAYWGKTVESIGPDWRKDAMIRISRLPAFSPVYLELRFLEWFAWRLTAAASFITLVLAVFLFQGDFQTEYELARLFLVDPLGFGAIQSFQVL